MPRGDGTGPFGGNGPGTGRGKGQGRGTGGGRNQGTKPGAGVGGACICPSCGANAPHQNTIPCNQVQCPKCGTLMIRQ